MKLNKIITTALFSVIAAQTITATTLEVGSAPISLEPHFLQESLSYDRQSQELSVSVSSAKELDVNESIPSEEHSSFTISGEKKKKKSGAIAVDISGKSTVVAYVKGSRSRAKLSDSIELDYNTSNENGNKNLTVSFNVAN